jgi:hypothetical protein
VHACQCAERPGPPKIVTFLLQKLQKLQYSQLYRLIAQASTHLIGTTPVGDPVTPSERLGPVERGNGRIAVLARRPAENGDVFCDFVASMGREGPPSILATSRPRLRTASGRWLALVGVSRRSSRAGAAAILAVWCVAEVGGYLVLIL